MGLLLTIDRYLGGYMFCNQCGAMVKDGQSFCQSCGARLATSQASSVSVPNAQPVNTSISGQGYQQPTIKNSKKSPIIAIIAIAILLIALVAGGVVFAFSSGLFLSPSDKVLVATTKSLKIDSKLSNSASTLVKLLNDEFTIEVDGNAENVNFSDATISYGKGHIQAAGDVSFMVMKAKDCIIDLDDDALRCSLPKLYESTIAYYYNEDAPTLEDISYGQLEVVNTILKSINEVTHKKNIALTAKDIVVFKKWWNGLEFNTDNGVKIKTDDGKLSCTMYSVEIDADDVIDLVDITEDFVADKAGDEFAEALESYNIDSDEFFDDLREEINRNYNEALTLEFYVSKGKLVRLDVSGTETDGTLRIELKGEKVPGLETEILVKQPGTDSFETVASLLCDIDGKRENYSLNVEDFGTIDLKYDPEDGEYTLNLVDDYEGECTVEGILIAKGKKCTFEVSNVEMYGYSPEVSFTATISAGAKFKRTPSEELKLNNLDLSELMEVGQEIENNVGF